MRATYWVQWWGRIMALALAVSAGRGQGPEQLGAWEFFKELPTPQVAPPSGLVDFLLDIETLDKARTDHADLRLYDAAGREIPYALRIRREIQTTEAFQAREFDRGTEGDVAQVSFDLGETPQQHNEVEIATPGENYRRMVEVQGGDDGRRWSTLNGEGVVFRFSSMGQTAQQKGVAYPISRYRYLRIRVRRDPQVDRAAPQIGEVKIRRTIRVQAQWVDFPSVGVEREATRADGRAASAYRLNFGGRIPIERLVVPVSGTTFSRPYRLESIDNPTEPVFLSSGEIFAREDAPTAAPVITFAEHFARRFKLTITDDRNPPLPIFVVTGRAAARQVIFEALRAAGGAARLYYGNQKASAPRYDLGARLPWDRTPAAFRLALGPERVNPIYRPEPKPLTERSPWLVYLVLGAASVGLAAILLNLAKAARATIET